MRTRSSIMNLLIMILKWQNKVRNLFMIQLKNKFCPRTSSWNLWRKNWNRQPPLLPLKSKWCNDDRNDFQNNADNLKLEEEEIETIINTDLKSQNSDKFFVIKYLRKKIKLQMRKWDWIFEPKTCSCKRQVQEGWYGCYFFWNNYLFTQDIGIKKLIRMFFFVKKDLYIPGKD